MPGAKSLKMQQYYGHAGNQFWRIIFSLFGVSIPEEYKKKKEFLLDKRIALWDVLEYCERDGSLDNNIRNGTPNNFQQFYQVHPLIKQVFLTSTKANEFYDKYVGKCNERTYFLLPSPSRANTWKTVDEKLDEWKIILEYL